MRIVASDGEAEPDADVVACLEDMLERARRGEITSVVAVYEMHGDLAAHTRGGHSLFALVAAASALHATLVDELRGYE